MADSQEPYQSAKQIAARLGIRPEWVYRLAKAGELPHLRIGTKIVRFRMSDVLQALQAHTEEVRVIRQESWKRLGDHARQKQRENAIAKRGLKRLEAMGLI